MKRHVLAREGTTSRTSLPIDTCDCSRRQLMTVIDDIHQREKVDYTCDAKFLHAAVEHSMGDIVTFPHRSTVPEGAPSLIPDMVRIERNSIAD